MSISYVWDYDITEQQFVKILSGKLSLGCLDKDWAAVRFLEYATIPRSFEDWDLPI